LASATIPESYWRYFRRKFGEIVGSDSRYRYPCFHQILVEGIGLVRRLILLHGPRSRSWRLQPQPASQQPMSITIPTPPHTHSYRRPPSGSGDPWCGLVGISDDNSPPTPSRFPCQLLSTSTGTLSSFIGTHLYEPPPLPPIIQVSQSLAGFSGYTAGLIPSVDVCLRVFAKPRTNYRPT